MKEVYIVSGCVVREGCDILAVFSDKKDAEAMQCRFYDYDLKEPEYSEFFSDEEIDDYHESHEDWANDHPARHSFYDSYRVTTIEIDKQE